VTETEGLRLYSAYLNLNPCLVTQVERCSAVAEMSDHLATIDIGRRLGGCAPLGGAGSPSNTMWPGPRSTSLPSGILIHPAVLPQQTWAEKWGLCPFLGRSCVPIQHNVAWVEDYIRSKWHLDPSSCLATRDTGRKSGVCCTSFCFFGGSWVRI